MATPKKGDIIRFPRDAYDHFGLYIGQGQVIHRSGPPGASSSAPDSAFSFSGGKSSKADIRIDELQVVAGDSKKAEIANYLDNEMNPFSPDEIVKRAMSKKGQKGYNVMFMNCEHFVTWCRYGVEYSKQAQPNKGDIIRFRREIYDHFAVYIGDGKVIHRAGDPHKQDDAKAEIRVDSLRDVAGPKRKAELANYLDKKHRPLPPDEIVERARKRLGQKGYNLLSKNCEHFATWCRYGDGIGVTQGEGISEQVTHYTNNFGMGIVDDCPEYVMDQMPERGAEIAIP